MTPNEPVLRVALDRPLRQTFDYLPPAIGTPPAPGCRVAAPFGRQRYVGIVIEHGADSTLPRARLKRVAAVLDAEPVLEPALLGLLVWAADYYHHPIGEVAFAALPTRLREGAPQWALRTIWMLTAAGREAYAAGEPARAPRQRALLELIASCEAASGESASASDTASVDAGVDEETLAASGPGWRDAARPLARRGWIESREQESQAGAADGPEPEPSVPDYELSPEQAAAVEAIDASADRFGAFLVHGITGSGKTEVYLQAVERVLARGGSALVLVPEIGLTPQLIARFQARFARPIATLHSGLTPPERLRAWRDARSGRARIVLGTRSAVFAPLPRLGIIIVDEEHDASFKQHESGFRYSARDLAIMRARRADLPVVLGSATPSLESLHNAEHGRYTLLRLPRRAGHARPPRVALVDLRTQAIRHGLSTAAVEAIRRHLDEQGQVLVYINRRGYAPTLACNACGWLAGCTSCDARLTVHQGAARLRCHYCGSDERLPESCPQCGYPVKAVGQGTERVEETLVSLFPDAPPVRLDRDTARDGAELEAIVSRVASGEARILVGTQMITKGHHFPDVTLALVLNADHGLYSTDFRAAERLAQTIVQVAGRAGRGERAGEVLIQTEYPDHPLLQSLLTEGYEGFARTALAERKAADWPPWTRLAAVRASATSLQEAVSFLTEARRVLAVPRGVRALGPAPAAMTRRAARYHAHLLFESADRASLHRFLADWLPRAEALPAARRVRWALDVDPLELL